VNEPETEKEETEQAEHDHMLASKGPSIRV